MPTVAIISEYNPFHNGHKYHIDRIRGEFGPDTTIIAIMSGNFTQRGEVAIADKALRARWAVDCGINLCLELPFPFSISSAEIFARSAVYILDRIGVVDYLSFGSECGDISALTSVATAMLSEEYQNNLTALLNKRENKGAGYPELCDLAYRMTYGEGAEYVPPSSNNILALEYIKALRTLGSAIVPHTIKREGAAYNQGDIIASDIQSATAIRNAIESNMISALEYVPNSTKKSILSAIQNGDMPCDEDAISSAVIASFRLNHPSRTLDILDAAGGLYNRLEEASFAANTIQDLVRIAETKKFTKARIRRAVWYSFFGVTSSEVKCYPQYTQLLAMDEKGRYELKRIKRRSDFPILTKPSNTSRLDDLAKSQKAFSDRADSIFQMVKPVAPHGGYALTFTPYVKTDE